jgi:hypothetical protein
MAEKNVFKSSIIVLSMVVFLIMAGVSVYAFNSVTKTSSHSIIASKDIRVSMVNQEPDPIEPGKYVTVRFKLENYGAESTAPIVVGIREKFPFTVLDNTKLEQNIGVLRGMQRTLDSQIIKWDLRVDKDAAEGLNEIIVYYMELEGQRAKVIYEDKFFVDIRVSDTVLSIVDIKTNPEKVTSGQEAKLILTLENKGSVFIKDVNVNLDLRNTDIITLGSTSEKIISRINGGERVNVSFNLLPDSFAELKAHQIPITLKYKDNLNNEYTHQSTFGLILESDVNYMVNIDDTNVFSVGKTGDVNLRVSNRGLNNIKFLTIELKPSLQYEVLSASEIYIGRIDSDDFDTVSFKIHANEADSDNKINLRLLLTFKDNYNNDYIEQEEIVLQLFNKNEIKKYGLDGGSGSSVSLIIIIVIILGIAYYIYHRKRKKRLEQEQDESD